MSNLIKCIDNAEGYCKLTIGKIYTILTEIDDAYMVINDSDKAQRYLKLRFETVDVNSTHTYFKPIQFSLNVEDNNIIIDKIKTDEDLLGVGDLHLFANAQKIHGISLHSESRYPYFFRSVLNLGGSVNGLRGAFLECSSNAEAIETAYKVTQEIKELNAVLVRTEKKQIISYGVEHEPNGKQYYFRSEQGLYIGQLVICDTVKGKQYGVIKSVIMEGGTMNAKRSICVGVTK